MRIHPSKTKASIVNYRAGDGSRKAPDKRVLIDHHGQLPPAMRDGRRGNCSVRLQAGITPRRSAGHADFQVAFEDYMAANPHRSVCTDELYRCEANRYLADWLPP